MSSPVSNSVYVMTMRRTSTNRAKALWIVSPCMSPSQPGGVRVCTSPTQFPAQAALGCDSSFTSSHAAQRLSGRLFTSKEPFHSTRTPSMALASSWPCTCLPAAAPCRFSLRQIPGHGSAHRSRQNRSCTAIRASVATGPEGEDAPDLSASFRAELEKRDMASATATEMEHSQGFDGEALLQAIQEKCASLCTCAPSELHATQLCRRLNCAALLAEFEQDDACRYDRSYDVTLVRREYLGRAFVAMNIMWAYAEQKSFQVGPLSLHLLSAPRHSGGMCQTPTRTFPFPFHSR